MAEEKPGLTPALAGGPAHWEAMMREADPLADRTVAAIIGPWCDGSGAMGPGIARIGYATRLMSQWTTNASLSSWAPEPGAANADVVAILRAYVAEASRLPEWADLADLDRADDIFMDYGPLSCVLLFCASLPQCYVLPHLSEVLHVAGQLQAHTEHRIRQTAAMVFPVMMKNGLAGGEGGGIAQILKVRLIHATIRHFILRGTPQEAVGRIDPAPVPGGPTNLQEALLANGWDVERQGLPCNQLELAYTLLTFSYVFLKGMRKLGVGLSKREEEAYLHTWNVAGHLLGIRGDLMAHTMKDAAALFKGIQAMARTHHSMPDVRPALGRALMDALDRSIWVPVIGKLPVPMTRWLIGRRTAREIGVNQQVGLLAQTTFLCARVAVRLIDAAGRLVVRRFSLTRMFTRVVGYHLLTRFLLDQTRPLGLPDELLQPMHRTVARWHRDRQAPRWVNRLEKRMTTAGKWSPGP
jgi:hypothetical protein